MRWIFPTEEGLRGGHLEMMFPHLDLPFIGVVDRSAYTSSEVRSMVWPEVRRAQAHVHVV